MSWRCRGLARELRDLEEGLAERSRHTLAGHEVLGEGANRAEHGQAAVLDLLELLLRVLLLRVAEANRVPAAGHAPAMVPRRVVALEAALVAAALERAGEEEDLGESEGGRLVESVDRVELAKVVAGLDYLKV